MAFIVSFIVLLLIHCSSAAASAFVNESKVAGVRIVPAVIAFGDSIIDPGNNNDIDGTLIKSNFAPYGVDFPNHISTGRFSNGRVVGDIIGTLINYKPALNYSEQDS